MYESRLLSEDTDRLFDALLSLSDREDCYRFFEDLCTVKELADLSQRWAVARMLHGGMRYADIAEQTGASTATIARVNRCLLYGADGYARVIKKLEPPLS